MKNLSEKIVKHKLLILIIALILLIPTTIGIIKTNINYNILVYLPEDIETMKGQDILTNDFNMGAFSISVLDNMSPKEIQKYEEKVRSINGVEKVLSINDLIGTTIPIEILPSELKDKVYKDNSTLLAITFKDSTSNERTLNAIREIRNISDKAKIGGMSAMVVDTMDLSDKEILTYIVIAVILCIIVLMICLDSYVVPFILLANIGLAILYNMGSNIILGDISYITKAISAVLQLGVTTDFSIFLYHRYEKEKKNNSKEKAMSLAIKDTFVSVFGSSLTTIAGFLALCTMTLLLGKDIGLVMAKGVLLGVICVLTVFPALLLIFDKYIDKTTHKVIMPEFNMFKNFALKHHKLILIIFIILIIPAYIGNKNVNVYYNLSKSLPEDLPFNIANTEVENKFGIGSPTLLLIDKNLKNNTINEMVNEINNIDDKVSAMSLSKLSSLNIPDSMINDDIKNLLKSDKYQLVLVNSENEIATNELNEEIESINKIVKKYDKDAIVAGEGPLMKDLIKISDTDFHNVNYTSILVIFIIMLFVLKSLSLPIILICAIEFAILLNMASFYYTGVTLPFIASIIIGTIQLGATIDYAILMTTKYLEKRKDEKDKYKAMKYALDNSVKSIITSGLCFFGATFGVGFVSKIDMIGSICHLIARGAIISMLVVILILPSLLLTFDKLIIKTTKNFKKGNNNMKSKKILTSLLIGLLILPISVNAKKDETVYSIIDSNNNQTTIVSEILESQESTIIDESDLENIINVNGDEEYFKDNNKITWKSNGNSIYYQGTSTKKLPIDINVKYYLDNKEVNVKSISGKSGHIKVQIDYKNLDKHGDLYTPFVVTMGTIIKEDAKNVKVSLGKVLNNGKQNIVVAIATPGLSDSLGINDLEKLNRIIIEYDTNNFEESDIYNVYSSNLLSNSDLKVFDKLDELYTKANTLSTSSTKLVNGSKELSSGMNKYNTSFKTYTNGVKELNKGTKTLSSSYKQINNGIVTINSSVGELTSIIDSLDALKNGLNKIYQAIGSESDIQNNNDKTLFYGTKSLSVAILDIENYVTLMKENDSLVYTGLNCTTPSESTENLCKATTANIKMADGILSGLNKMKQGLTKLESGFNSIKQGLENINKSMPSNEELNNKSKMLVNGLSSLKNGSQEFNNGLEKLSSSTDKINDATSSLSTASNTLNDGLKTLTDGLEKFDKEGIQKIVSFVNNDLKSMESKLKRLQKLGNDYNSFTSKTTKNDSETKFIVKIEAN